MSRGLPMMLLLAVGCERSPLPSTPFDTGLGGHLMSGFSWVVDDSLAGMPQPGAGAPLDLDFGFLQEQQIDLIVSANFEGVDPVIAATYDIDQVSLPVMDFEAPTQLQMVEFVSITRQRLANDERVVVHCTAGLGRAGTYLAAWFVSDGMTADEAIEYVRSLRPGSIETFSQETAIREYWSSVSAPRAAR